MSQFSPQPSFESIATQAASAPPAIPPVPTAEPPVSAPVSAPAAMPSQAVPAEPTISQPPVSLESAPAAPPAAPSTVLLDKLAAMGQDVTGIVDDDQALAILMGGISRLQEVQPLVQYGQKYLERATEFEKWSAEQEAARQQPAQPAKPAWQPPEYDSAWEQLFQLDAATGRYVPRTGVAQWVTPQATEAINKYHAWHRDYYRDLARDPVGTLWEKAGLGDRFKSELEAFRQELRQEQEKAAAVAETDQFIQEHQKELYMVDAGGQVQRDPRGQPILTPAGKALEYYGREAQQLGLTEPAAIRNYATRLTDAWLATQQHSPGPQVPPSPTAPSAQPSPRFLSRALGAAHVANAEGTTVSAAAGNGIVQNPNLSFSQMAHAVAQQMGVSP